MITLSGCSAIVSKTVIDKPTNVELLIQQCEAKQSEKCYLAALSIPMMNRIKKAVKYYDKHYGEKWL